METGQRWQERYKDKLVSLEEAATKIESDDVIWSGPSASAPIGLMVAIGERYRSLSNVKLISGLSLYPYRFFESRDYRPHIEFTTLFYGPYERRYYHENVQVNSVSLSQMAKTVTQVYRANTLLADVSLPDEAGNVYFGAVGTMANKEVSEHVEKIIVNINKHQPQTSGWGNKINLSEVDWICVEDRALPEMPQPEITETDTKIAELIGARIKDGSTIQLGIGGLSNAIGYSLKGKKNLACWSEMFTDSMAYLARHGILTGRKVASFALGSQQLYDYLASGDVEMIPTSVTNDPYEIGKQNDFVSVNSCLMADLTGQIGSESIGTNQYSSTGGQLDFVKGAALSKGGQSFCCLPATNVNKKTGEVTSTISLTLLPGSAVTTPRSEVMSVVTEFGIADLQNQPLHERAKRMIAIAHPDFREQLRKEAVAVGLLKK